MRRLFIIAVVAFFILIALIAVAYPLVLWSLLVAGPIIAVGFHDYFQTKHSILRNFPIMGHFRFLFEEIRPEIHQYFVESETDGVPFSREQRSVVYQRAKGVRDTIPFGTLQDVYEIGYEWVNHSLQPAHVPAEGLRVQVGGPDCTQPYSASIFNISAMSFGALSGNAVLALSQGAKMGNFAHNTGEGSISSYHLAGGADLIWQIGTGYFGCRTLDGNFDVEAFAEQAAIPNVKMIEIKLSQGAKPGHGGILPAAKLSEEIAQVRRVPLGKDVISPPAHSAFSTPIEFVEFIAQLRERSGGKPVGFKLSIGKRREFLAICKAMVKTGITPDFITVDGGEGGTGAAPLEFANNIGTPLIEALVFTHSALVGYSVRDKIRVIASGKVMTGFAMVKRLALGADMCYSARGMMMALGCIQALKCNSNHCPVGITTQNPDLAAGLVPAAKNVRVASFHKESVESVAEIIGAMGIRHPSELRPWHILRRISPTEIKHYRELYEFLEDGDLLKDPLPFTYRRACEAASAESFERAVARVYPRTSI